MKRHVISKRPVYGTFVVLLAALLFAPGVPAQAADVITEISVNGPACTAAFTTTNCRNGKNPNGDICVAKGPNTQPMLIFKLESPFPTGSKIKRIDVRLNQDFTCPSDVNEDFKDISAPGCYYEPNPANNTLQLKNNNKHTRVYYYWLTLEIGGCTGDVEVHPLIENGGGNN